MSRLFRRSWILVSLTAIAALAVGLTILNATTRGHENQSVDETSARVADATRTTFTVQLYTPTPTWTPISTGDPTLDRVLGSLVQGTAEIQDRAWAELIGTEPLPCDDARPTTHPACSGAAAGSRVSAFDAEGCSIPFVGIEQARVIVASKIERRAGRDVYGVVRGGIPGLTTDGYLLEGRNPSGNVGDLWYLSAEGRIIGVRSACSGYSLIAGQTFDNPHYLYGPCMGGTCATPTPTP